MVNGSCTGRFHFRNNGTHALATLWKKFNDYTSTRFTNHSFSKTIIQRSKLDALILADPHIYIKAQLTFEVHDDVRNESYPNEHLFKLSGFDLEERKWITMEMFANDTGTVVGSSDGTTVWCNGTRSEGSCGQNGLPQKNSSISVAITHLFFHHMNTRKFNMKFIGATGAMFPCQSVGKYYTIMDWLYEGNSTKCMPEGVRVYNYFTGLRPSEIVVYPNSLGHIFCTIALI